MPTSLLSTKGLGRLDSTLLPWVSDYGETREGSRRLFSDSRNLASVASPGVALFAVSYLSQPGDLVLDPFAGGGTRALVSAGLRRDYLGAEIRPDQVEVSRGRIVARRLDHSARILTADSARLWWGAEAGRKATLVLTCPPYHQLERYRGGPGDLSEIADYAEFLGALGTIIEAIGPAVDEATFAAWVVGPITDSSSGHSRDLPGDVKRLHSEHGWFPHSDFVIPKPGGARRAGAAAATRRCVTSHEMLAVMRRTREPRRMSVAPNPHAESPRP